MEKPLPELPMVSKHVHPGTNLSSLTLEARTHLRKFISQTLDDQGEAVTPGGENEEWVDAFEGALRELGEKMSMGGWLVGLRRARMQRIKTDGAQRPMRTESKGTVKEDNTKGKGAQTQNGEHKNEMQHEESRGQSSQESEVALETLQKLVSNPKPPTPKPTSKHLLLAVAAYGSTYPQSSENTSYEFVPAVGCSFSAGSFALPHSLQEKSGGEAAILYGLNEWQFSEASDNNLQLVGGTFTFRGTASLLQHHALIEVLHLSIFVYLSIILEQQLFMNSYVTLRFPIPSLSPTIPSSASGSSVHRALSTSQVGNKPRRGSGSGLWAFISKKKDDFLHRATAVGPALVRRGSLELPLAHRTTNQASYQPRTSEDGRPRSRRTSFIADIRSSLMPSHKEHQEPEEPVSDLPFTSALSLLRKYEGLLSTSPNLTLPPPSLLVNLAEREKRDPKRKLTGDERAALTSLLGWDTSKAESDRGKGMTGTAGFVRQQGFSALYSEFISSPDLRPLTPASQESVSSSTISVPPTPPKPMHHGSRRRWITYRFYGPDGTDECLGQAVVRMCETAEEPCTEIGCLYKRAEHEMQWIHGGVRIVVSLRSSSDTDTKAGIKQEGLPEMWESCVICGKKSNRERMLDGTYLFSFAKYLELLVYSPTIFRLSIPLCMHTTIPPRPWSATDVPLPRMRMNIVRNFSWKGRVLSFSLCPVEDVFEVRVPRLQILRGKALEKAVEPQSQDRSPEIEADRRMLRREIMRWWQGLSERMDELEENFVAEPSESYRKALPRLPSSDDAYNLYDEEGAVTPKAHPSKLPPPSTTPQTPKNTSSPHSYPFPSEPSKSEPCPEQSSTASTLSTLSSASHSSTDSDSLHKLSGLRHTFQRTEQNLYVELARTPESCLNNVRRSFLSAARGATKRLSAWEEKHSAHLREGSSSTAQLEPEWWQSGCHAVPGGSIIVRESDWGSIIAFTLSSMDYHRELASMSSGRSAFVPPAPPTPPATPNRPSLFQRTVSSSKWFAAAEPQPDPDQEGVIWHEPETYSAIITRREHPRDPASLLALSIPEVLRPKSPAEMSGTQPTSKFGSVGSASGKGLSHGIPPLAWAKPNVAISMQAADGRLSGASAEALDKIVQELGAVSDATPVCGRNPSSDSHPSSSGFVETHIRRGKASSIISTDSDATTVGLDSNNSPTSNPPLPPPKDKPDVPSIPPNDAGTEPPAADPTASTKSETVTASLTSTLSAALRYMVKTGEVPPTPAKYHHGLLSAVSPAIDDRPHIKYDWTIGQRLKFSCTVYYAKQFDSLRRRCGIEDVFLRSLSRSDNWAAQGGKSKSNFWKTSDDQFIIKTLVNAWNVGDLQALIELGPSYFRYMDATASKPTVLAKLLGFYTVEIRNLETGNTQSKADLLVMENIFYDQKIVKTFDLKGIQGRKVKASSSSSKTLFDGEWIEGQQRALTLVRPHSKVILNEAIRADCEFLAKSNIMDYSLLLGIDEEHKQLACGLVDTIGSYTFAKTLEYKAKQGLNSGKEVTVVPPGDYQERFVSAMNSYFLACPDKWSRPLDNTKVPSDYRQLPSVL